MEETENPDHCIEVMNWIGLDRIMFSRDYPHWDFDDPFVSLPPSADRRAAPHDLRRQRAGAVPAGLMAKKHVVAAASEIPPGGRKLVTADGRAIVVFNLGGEFFALSTIAARIAAAACARAISPASCCPTSPANTTTSAAARSSAARGTPGSSTSAPASPGAIPTRCKARRFGVSVEKGAKLVEGPYVAETFRVSVENDYVVVEA